MRLVMRTPSGAGSVEGQALKAMSTANVESILIIESPPLMGRQSPIFARAASPGKSRSGALRREVAWRQPTGQSAAPSGALRATDLCCQRDRARLHKVADGKQP